MTNAALLSTSALTPVADGAIAGAAPIVEQAQALFEALPTMISGLSAGMFASAAFAPLLMWAALGFTALAATLFVAGIASEKIKDAKFLGLNTNAWTMGSSMMVALLCFLLAGTTASVMGVTLPVLGLAAGLTALKSAGEMMVDNAKTLAKRAGMSDAVIGATLVAGGTSSPELATSVMASEKGLHGLSVGNVIGSNIVNELLIFTAGYMLWRLLTIGKSADGLKSKLQQDAQKKGEEAEIDFDRTLTRNKDIRLAGTMDFLDMFMFAASALLLAAAAFGWLVPLGLSAGLSPTLGFAMIGSWGLYALAKAWLSSQQQKAAQPDAEKNQTRCGRRRNFWRADSARKKEGTISSLIATVAGIAGLIFGADMLVTGAVNTPLLQGLPEEVIGQTVVATGTSLPEMMAVFYGLMKGSAGLAVGAIIGSNIFNILVILGVVGAASGDAPTMIDGANLDVGMPWLFGVTAATLLMRSLPEKFGGRIGLMGSLAALGLCSQFFMQNIDLAMAAPTDPVGSMPAAAQSGLSFG